MSSNPAEVQKDYIELEKARLRAELTRANVEKLKLAHELERVKSDRNILEQYLNEHENDDLRDPPPRTDLPGAQGKKEKYHDFQLRRLRADIKVLESYRDEFHRHLENDCSCLRDNSSQITRQQITLPLVPIHPSKPMAPDSSITTKASAGMDGEIPAQAQLKPQACHKYRSNHQRGNPPITSYDSNGHEMKPKKEVIDLLLSSDGENDGSKTSSTKQPTTVPESCQKTSEDCAGMQGLETSATLPVSLSDHASKDGDKNDDENESVPRTAQKKSPSHAWSRNEVDTKYDSERKQVSPVQLRLDMRGTPSAQLDYPLPKRYNMTNLPSVIVSSRITSTFKYSTTRITADAEVLQSTFKRTDLAKCCGGNPQETFPSVRKELVDQHGYKRFMCAVPVYNPYIPQVPGAAGLYFALNDEKYWPHERELVIVRHEGPDAVWNVMGNYEIKKSTPLTPQEFRMLPQEVQRGWLKSVKETNWGKPTCASIFSRSLEFRDQKKSEMSDNEADFTPAEIQKNTTLEDIEKAFFSGEERINVWTMRCVKYDEKFKRRIIEGHQTDNQSVNARSSRRRVRRSVSSEIELSAETQKLKRRRRNESDESSDLSDLEENGDYTIARTRARKET